jgi:serine/threonine protein phosphatase 1
MSLIAVGDIHGNFRALDDLLHKIIPELSAGDSLVFLGDYIDRGPHVRECVDAIIELKTISEFSVVTLLGNHEDWMLRSYRDHTAHSWVFGMESFDTIASYSTEALRTLKLEIERGGMKLILEKSALPYEVFFDSLPPTHLEFFNNLRRYYREDGIVCSHGGLDTKVDVVEQQHPDAFLWGSKAFPDGYCGTPHIVYGHHGNALLDKTGWPQPNIKPNRTYGIDTIAHGVLTAIRFPGADIFQSDRFLV